MCYPRRIGHVLAEDVYPRRNLTVVPLNERLPPLLARPRCESLLDVLGRCHAIDSEIPCHSCSAAPTAAPEGGGSATAAAAAAAAAATTAKRGQRSSRLAATTGKGLLSEADVVATEVSVATATQRALAVEVIKENNKLVTFVRPL